MRQKEKKGHYGGHYVGPAAGQHNHSAQSKMQQIRIKIYIEKETVPPRDKVRMRKVYQQKRDSSDWRHLPHIINLPDETF